MRESVELELIFIDETDEAVLVKDEEGGRSEWIPKSQIEYDDFVLVPGMTNLFTVNENTAIEVGFV